MFPTLFVILALAVLYWFPVRRWMARWGTTASDLTRVMAGDSLIVDPTYSGTMLVELGRPPLSIASQLYQPARPLPICAIHGHTCSGGALMVMAWVEVKMESEIIASTGSERRLSRTVGTHVANAITKWMEQLLCRRDR